MRLPPRRIGRAANDVSPPCLVSDFATVCGGNGRLPLLPYRNHGRESHRRANPTARSGLSERQLWTKCTGGGRGFPLSHPGARERKAQSGLRDRKRQPRGRDRRAGAVRGGRGPARGGASATGQSGVSSRIDTEALNRRKGRFVGEDSGRKLADLAVKSSQGSESATLPKRKVWPEIRAIGWSFERLSKLPNPAIETAPQMMASQRDLPAGARSELSRAQIDASVESTASRLPRRHSRF